MYKVTRALLTKSGCGQEDDGHEGRAASGESERQRVLCERQCHNRLGTRPNDQDVHPHREEGRQTTEGVVDIGVLASARGQHRAQLTGKR